MTFHLYRVNEIFSNADGTVQFIEMTTDSDFENEWAGHALTVTSGTTHSFTMPSNLPSAQTANTTVLLATQGFANLGIVTPDFIIPDGFLFLSGGAVNFGVFPMNYTALPTDGTHSLNGSNAVTTASPRNFAGQTGVLTPGDTTPPTVTAFSPLDEATGVAITSNVLVTFNEDVARGTGSIVLKTAAGATVETFNAATSDRLSISGHILTIDPTANLLPHTSYKLEFAAGSVKDLANNNYAGTTSYNFETAVNVINGTATANLLTGLATDDEIHGFAGNDTLDGGAGGHDTLDGGAGTDTAVLHFASSGITLVNVVDGHLHVVSNTGETTFIDVERIRLNDALVALDTQANGPLWQAEALLFAGIGQAPTTALLSQWVHAADQGVSMAALGQQMLDFYAPGLSTSVLVNLLFSTVVGITPTTDQVNSVVELVGPGHMFPTNGDLFAYVASLSLNTDRFASFTGSSFQLLDPSFFSL